MSRSFIEAWWLEKAIEDLDMILHCLNHSEHIILDGHEEAGHSYFNLQQEWIKRYPKLKKEFPFLAKEIKDRTINYRNFLVQLLDLEKKAYLEEDKDK